MLRRQRNMSLVFFMTTPVVLVYTRSKGFNVFFATFTLRLNMLSYRRRVFGPAVGLSSGLIPEQRVSEGLALLGRWPRDDGLAITPPPPLSRPSPSSPAA